LLLVWIQFAICILLIVFFGAKLSRNGDIIAEKTGLSGIWVGLLLIAVITSLPEIITGVSAVPAPCSVWWLADRAFRQDWV